MASVTEYFEKLQKLTQRNLDILQAINDAFYSNKSHLLINVGEEQYTIPSFMHLENKINALQDGFNNLVYAPKTGEASFNFDGNSQTIELRGFTCTPQSVELKSPVNFNVENNHIFKDFLTPNPYVNFDLSSIPNDISKVCVKKIVALSQTVKDEFASMLELSNSKPIVYNELNKILSLYEINKDYIEYENIRELPIRKSIGTGLYIIKSIDDHKILDDLTETYTITISNELKYTLFDETIEKYLQAGDELVTFDDSAKLRIRKVHHNTNQLEVDVMNGDYLNLVADTRDDSQASDMSKLKFFSPIDSNKDKYINVPLEEDQYIAVFVSPLNNRMNIRAPWGTGVVIDAYLLTDINNEKSYKDFYDENVSNIGDILYELTSISSNGITKYSNDEFNLFSNYKPLLSDNELHVYQINNHLNNSPTIQKIRTLYNQKLKYNNDLEDIQKSIDNINSTLSSISFDDTTNIRIIYEGQLTELDKKRNELVASINKVMEEISTAANESEIPIENAKFRIRGFYDINNDSNIEQFKDHINGIRVWYRYKNQNQETGNAHSVGSEYVFSDWNEMPITKRMRSPHLDSLKYTYDYGVDTSKVNEPSFNQIDIPITQGESVDIKLQIIWDFGFPFIETTSGWSDVISVEFPEELKKSVRILDIIEENNSEIEKYRFTNILTDNGITKHVDDKLIDQDLTYFHQPEHVASGFYTTERRVIPLKDKLLSIDSEINTLKDEVFGYDANNLKVTVIINNILTPILPNQENVVYTDGQITGANLQLSNNSNRNIKLYSLFPGSRTIKLGDSNYTNKGDFDFDLKLSGETSLKEQTLNQYIYFRSKDVWTTSGISFGYATPFIKDAHQLCLDSDSKFDYVELKPNESVVVNLLLDKENLQESTIKQDDETIVNQNNMLQFTVRMSLYSEPVTYEMKFTTNNESLIAQFQTSQIDYKSVVK